MGVSSIDAMKLSISVFFLDCSLSFFYLVSRFLHQFLLSLAGSGRNEIVSAMNIEDSMGILTLLDLIDEAMILLGHHLA